MAGVRFTELQSRPMEFLDFTSVTLAEFQPLVPPFETAFQCHMAAWRMDGKPRTARRWACSHFSGQASSRTRCEVAICFNRFHRPGPAL